MKDKIIDIIIKLTEYEDLRNNPDVNLIEEDILDSLAFIELISELENEFDIEIQPTQIPNDTWNSIDNIVKMVKNLKAE
jgi:D-alanine--poly(phosphoribitol) ligase subunit 2